MKLVAGYIFIFMLSFITKGCNYVDFRKTKGKIISLGKLTYRSIRIRGRYNSSYLYPIAEFRGPTRVKHYKVFTYKSEEQEKRPQADPKDLDSLQLPLPEERKAIILQRITDIDNGYHDSTEMSDIYLTAEPTGAYFFHNFNIGDSIDIIYEEGHPSEAIIDTFSSYWLPLPRLEILIFLCLVWTAIHNVATKKYA